MQLVKAFRAAEKMANDSNFHFPTDLSRPPRHSDWIGISKHQVECSSSRSDSLPARSMVRESAIQLDTQRRRVERISGMEISDHWHLLGGTKRFNELHGLLLGISRADS